MGRNRHKWSSYFKILDELANKSNKAAICRACIEVLGDEAKKITNKANLCYNHLKSCPNFAQKYTTEELKKILQQNDKEILNESNNESNSESDESSSKKVKTVSQNLIKPVKRQRQTSVNQYLCHPLPDNIQQQFERHLIRGTVMNGLSFRWIQDEDIIAAFKLANPAIQLPHIVLVTNIENSTNSDDKKFPSDIAEIINDSTFWNDLKELNDILLPFCATLNQLQCDSARLCDYKKVLEMSQFRGKIKQERKLKAIEKAAKQIHNPNILLPISSDTEEKIITNWSSLLRDEQFEEELDFMDVDEMVHPATNQDAKWPLLRIFQNHIVQPDSYNLLLGI
ncbi:5628_t:CDS:2 [Dentiscutata heterogama]|uniref:5628_t:CDS:1 n=1 Tax=Dentiscutata heterogama TaxID=1316150 RepID=A0ACA9KPM2_9GLOM|nr:5628_t:CDS:2 [Dentiscutata heterogama]